ncbi:zinc finger protein 585A-like [Littorina saxatilis]|uniref:C2H2-type domain-containing protein n=1 Tax=Littorina saxatilis TaxID=31220 RepID=A0AAN9BBN3_9CAEN
MAQQDMSVPEDGQVECKVETIKQIVVIEDDVVDLWHTVGASQGLTTDADVCRFLLSLCFSDREDATHQGVRCGRCNSLLTLVCSKCQLPSQVSSQQAMSSHTFSQPSLRSQPSLEQAFPSLPQPYLPLSSYSSPSSQTSLQVPSTSWESQSLLLSSQQDLHSSSPETLQKASRMGLSLQERGTSKSPLHKPLLRRPTSDRDEGSDGGLDMETFNDEGAGDSDIEMSFEQEYDRQESKKPSTQDLTSTAPTQKVCSETHSKKNKTKTAVVVLHKCDMPLSATHTDPNEVRLSRPDGCCIRNNKDKIGQWTGKYAIYGEPRKQYGAYKYYSSYTCSQCRKVFTLKSAFKNHMEKPNCDDNVSEEQFRRWVKGSGDIDSPRTKRKSALNVKFSHEDDKQGSEGEEGSLNDKDEERGASFSKRARRQKKVNYTRRKEYTLDEFMEGKFHIRLDTKARLYSHYTCFKCNTVCKTSADFGRHRKGRGDNPCLNPKGDKPSPRTELDSKSIELLLKIKEEMLHCCSKCDLVFGRKDFYMEHLITHAYTLDNEGKHVCNLCQGEFSEYKDLHLHAVIPPGKETCSVCGTVFISRCQVNSHQLIHTDDQRLTKCQRCGESVLRSEIKAHKKAHSEKSQKSICPQCGKCFMSRAGLSAHLSVHSDVRPFSCSVCDASFKKKQLLVSHQQTHGEKKKQCEICGAKFHREFVLKMHIQSHHLGLKFQCSICGHVFKTKFYHDKHKRQHLKQKSKECSHCGLRYHTTKELETHMRVHTGEKPFQCSFCPAKFGRQDYLRKHTRIHTGEKPHVCEDCGKRFTCVSSYVYHRKKWHSDKLLPCSVCGTVFVDQFRLNSHREKSHIGDKTEQEDCVQKPAYCSEPLQGGSSGRFGDSSSTSLNREETGSCTSDVIAEPGRTDETFGESNSA